MATKRLLRVLSAEPDLRPNYPPTRRPRHALVSGEPRTLCGKPVRAITPGGFDPDDHLVCPACRGRYYKT